MLRGFRAPALSPRPPPRSTGRFRGNEQRKGISPFPQSETYAPRASKGPVHPALHTPCPVLREPCIGKVRHFHTHAKHSSSSIRPPSRELGERCSRTGRRHRRPLSGSYLEACFQPGPRGVDGVQPPPCVGLVVCSLWQRWYFRELVAFRGTSVVCLEIAICGRWGVGLEGWETLRPDTAALARGRDGELVSGTPVSMSCRFVCFIRSCFHTSHRSWLRLPKSSGWGPRCVSVTRKETRLTR